jgi:hypothetical protein
VHYEAWRAISQQTNKKNNPFELQQKLAQTLVSHIDIRSFDPASVSLGERKVLSWA